MANATLDPNAVDNTPRFTLQVYSPPPTVVPLVAPKGTYPIELDNIKEYSYDQDVLTLEDPFCCTISSVDGAMVGKIKVGDSVTASLSDPSVGGGAKCQQLTGIITGLETTSDNRSGTTIQIRGADLGWHLSHNTGPLFLRFKRRSQSFSSYLLAVIDPSWHFQGVRSGNTRNATLKQGRQAFAPQNQGPEGKVYIPPIQIEPGEMIADSMITYARRLGCFVNVSADGYLQFFTPLQTQPVGPVPVTQSLYVINHYAASDSKRVNNNVKTAKLSQNIEGLYTTVTCVGQIIYTTKTQEPTTENPNVGKTRGTFAKSGVLPFVRRHSFSDSERINNSLAQARARWKWQRGQFDSWSVEYVVRGHSQVKDGVGTFYTPDTMIDVNDTVLGIQGQYYLSGVRFNRTMEGTTSTLTIRKPNLLGA